MHLLSSGSQFKFSDGLVAEVIKTEPYPHIKRRPRVEAKPIFISQVREV